MRPDFFLTTNDYVVYDTNVLSLISAAACALVKSILYRQWGRQTDVSHTPDPVSLSPRDSDAHLRQSHLTSMTCHWCTRVQTAPLQQAARRETHEASSWERLRSNSTLCDPLYLTGDLLKPAEVMSTSLGTGLKSSLPQRQHYHRFVLSQTDEVWELIRMFCTIFYPARSLSLLIHFPAARQSTYRSLNPSLKHLTADQHHPVAKNHILTGNNRK